MSLCAHRNRTSTPTQLRYSLYAVTGRLVSTLNICRSLHESGLHASRAAYFVLLMSRHCRERLKWAQWHVHWTLNHWWSALFIYESRFSLQMDRRHYLFWREFGTSVKELHTRGGGSVYVWGCTTLGGFTDLQVFPRGTVNAHTYRDDFLHAFWSLVSGNPWWFYATGRQC